MLVGQPERRRDNYVEGKRKGYEPAVGRLAREANKSARFLVLFSVFSVFVNMHFVFEECSKPKSEHIFATVANFGKLKKNAMIFDDLSENVKKNLQKKNKFKEKKPKIVKN